MKLTKGALFLQTGSAKAKGTSSSAPAAAATGAAYKIPSGISSGCNKFMTALDEDKTLGSCTAPLLKATSSFSSGNQNQNTLDLAIKTVCSATPCSDKYIRTQLTNFGTACQAELDPSSGDESVRDAYDILYVMQPFLAAICAKDSDGTYCAVNSSSQTANATSSSGGSKRADQTVYAPDTADYRNNGVMYLGILPSLSAKSLCTTCTQEVLSAYAQWEATVPYATGLSNSPMLGGQGDLWTQTKKTCGDSFMNVVTSSVGTANAEAANAGVSANQVGVSSAVAGVFAVAMGFWVAL